MQPPSVYRLKSRRVITLRVPRVEKAREENEKRLPPLWRLLNFHTYVT